MKAIYSYLEQDVNVKANVDSAQAGLDKTILIDQAIKVKRQIDNQ